MGMEPQLVIRKELRRIGLNILRMRAMYTRRAFLGLQVLRGGINRSHTIFSMVSRIFYRVSGFFCFKMKLIKQPMFDWYYASIGIKTFSIDIILTA